MIRGLTVTSLLFEKDPPACHAKSKDKGAKGKQKDKLAGLLQVQVRMSVTWIHVIAVEVADMTFVGGLIGCGDVTEKKIESRMSSISLP